MIISGKDAIKHTFAGVKPTFVLSERRFPRLPSGALLPKYFCDKCGNLQQLLVTISFGVSLQYSDDTPTYLGPTRLSPMGSPQLPANPGTVTTGSCKAVHSPQNLVLGLNSSFFGASPAQLGVIIASYSRAILSNLGRSVAI
jgi:hypothetical protein